MSWNNWSFLWFCWGRSDKYTLLPSACTASTVLRGRRTCAGWEDVQQNETCNGWASSKPTTPKVINDSDVCLLLLFECVPCCSSLWWWCTGHDQCSQKSTSVAGPIMAAGYWVHGLELSCPHAGKILLRLQWHGLQFPCCEANFEIGCNAWATKCLRLKKSRHNKWSNSLPVCMHSFSHPQVSLSQSLLSPSDICRSSSRLLQMAGCVK